MFPKIAIIYDETKDDGDDLKKVFREKFDDFLKEKERPYGVVYTEAREFIMSARKIDLLVFAPSLSFETIKDILNGNKLDYILGFGLASTAPLLNELGTDPKTWDIKKFLKQVTVA